MNDKSVVLTTESLKKSTYSIRSLNQEQRELLRDALRPYIGKKMWELDLKRILREFREQHSLSVIDVEAIADAFFDSPL